MKQMYRKSLVAAAIAALASAPALGQYTSPMQQLGQEHPAASRDNPSESHWSDQRQQGATAPAAQQQQQQAATAHARGSGELLAMSPSELKGVKVIDAQGEDVGRIESIVVSQADNQPHAVIVGGGFVGVGGKHIALPLNQLSWSGDQLRVDQTITALGELPAFNERSYVAVQPDNQPISEFSAFEMDQQGSPTMQQRGTTAYPGGQSYSNESGGNWDLSPSGQPLERSDPRRSSD